MIRINGIEIIITYLGEKTFLNYYQPKSSYLFRKKFYFKYLMTLIMADEIRFVLLLFYWSRVSYCPKDYNNMKSVMKIIIYNTI